MPVYCTALGKAMLAFSGDDEIERAIRRGLPSRTENTIVDPQAFRAELAAIREGGVAFDREESHRLYTCVAVPIRGSGRALSALSMTGLTATVDLDAAAQLMGREAREIWPKIFVPR